MRKTLFLILSLFYCTYNWSAPMGDPSKPKMVQQGLLIPENSWIYLFGEYEGNFVGDRRLKQRSNNMRRIDNFSLDTNSGKAAVDLLNRCELFGILGQSRICANWRTQNILGDLSEIEMETKYDFSWAAGAKVILLEWGNTQLTSGGRYFYTKPRMLWLTKNGVSYSVDDARMKFVEWQVDLGVSHKIDIFTPYIGIKYSQSHSTLATISSTTISDNDTNNLRMKSRNHLGIVLGYGSTTGKWYVVDVEVRLIDEAAVTISGGFRI